MIVLGNSDASLFKKKETVDGNYTLKWLCDELSYMSRTTWTQMFGNF